MIYQSFLFQASKLWKQITIVFPYDLIAELSI